MLNQAVCSKRSGVSSPRSFFSQRSSTSRRTTAGLCFVDGIPSRASLIRLAFSASSATLNSMSLTILNFMFFFYSNTSPGQIELNYDCNICRRGSDLRRKIYAQYLQALLFVNYLNGLLMAFSFRQAERKLEIL